MWVVADNYEIQASDRMGVIILSMQSYQWMGVCKCDS